MSENMISKIKIGNIEYELETSIDNINGLQDVLDDKATKDYVNEQIEAIDTQSDWNQTDETASDYIKNRPFYQYSTLTPVLSLTAIKTSDTTLSLSVNWSDLYNLYIWSGRVRYADLVVDAGLGFSETNGYISLTIDGTETRLPPDSTQDVILTGSGFTEESYLVEFCNIETVSKKIDEVYLPDTVLTSDSLYYIKPGEGVSSVVMNAVDSNTAPGDCSHAEGQRTTASGNYSHAEGGNTTASGTYSHAEGDSTIAQGRSQHVQGEYNILDDVGVNDSSRGAYVHIVGNGTQLGGRSNAHTLDWDGNAWYQGDVYVGSTSGTNKDDGSERLARVSEIPDAIINPSTASVGQTMVVKSVDENGKPTEWEVMYLPEVPAIDSTLSIEGDAADAKSVGDAIAQLSNKNVDCTTYGLPVLHLTGDVTSMSKETKIPLSYVYGELSGECTMKWQGSSSLVYPKKNYTIQFDNPFEAAAGWGEQKKYCLKANYIDHSHARNLVSAKLWGEIVKSRTYNTSSFDVDYVTGAVFGTTGTDKSSFVSVTDNVITVTSSAVDQGTFLFTGNTFVAGKYTVAFEVYNPNETDLQRFRLAYGKVGTYNTAYFYDVISAPYGEWTAVTKEIEFTEDGGMIGLIGDNGANYQFRNISVVPMAANTSSFDVSKVTGAVFGTTGKDESSHVSIDGDIITIDDHATNIGGILLEGNTFAAGRYTVSLEVYNPNDAETDTQQKFRLLYGKVGTYNTAYFYELVDAPCGEWTSVVKEIEFSEDDSMIGFIGHTAANYQFRNISVVLADTEVLDIKNLQKLVNGGAVDGFPCVITLNGDFHGLYTFNIPKDGWMFGMGNGLREAIVCADNGPGSPCAFMSATATFSDFSLEYAPDENNTDWILASLNRCISAVMNSDGTDLDTTIAQYLDWQSAIDYMIFTILLGGHDMYRKNYILATYNGIKWFFSAYDMDSTYGIHWSGEKFLEASIRPFLNSYEHRVMQLIYTYKKDELLARYDEIRSSVMSEDNVYHKFTNFAAEVPSTILAEDAKLWSTILSTSASNTAQILNWYRMRSAFIDKKADDMRDPCDMPESGLSVKLAKALAAFFTDFETLLPQLAYIQTDHIGDTLISDSKTLVKLLNDIPPSSLSAVYSGGYVTIGTDLSNIRKDIVVTGTYSDGSTSEITDYELTGDIVDGESTLTITIGEVSTTITVIGTPYTYLYSNGYEYTDITGGWVNEGNIGVAERTTISKENGMLTITAENDETKYSAVNTYATKNAIDLTPYSKFVIEGEFYTSSANGSANVRGADTLITDADYTVAYENSVVLFNATKSETTSGTFETDLSTIDFSALDASQVYIALSAGIWAASTSASCKVTSIYLVPATV